MLYSIELVMFCNSKINIQFIYFEVKGNQFLFCGGIKLPRTGLIKKNYKIFNFCLFSFIIFSFIYYLSFSIIYSFLESRSIDSKKVIVYIENKNGLPSGETWNISKLTRSKRNVSSSYFWLHFLWVVSRNGILNFQWG